MGLSNVSTGCIYNNIFGYSYNSLLKMSNKILTLKNFGEYKSGIDEKE